MVNARTSLVASTGSTSASSAAAPSLVDRIRRRISSTVEQLLALLAHERPPKQDAQLADVAAQAGLGLSR